MPRSEVAWSLFLLQYKLMKLVPFEESDEKEVPAPIPEVPANLYGELFFAADWSVLNSPSGRRLIRNSCLKSLMRLAKKSGMPTSMKEAGKSVLLLVRQSGPKASGAHNRLEVQFIASDFLQGHDYELNVRYAPESWDACEQDVIVLRAFDGDREPEHPNLEQVKVLTRALRKLQEREESVPSEK